MQSPPWLQIAERALASQRSHQIRIFRKLETLVEYLKGVGIPRFDVDAVNYDPEGEHAYKRPDRAEAMKHAHQAAAYDKWLKAEIQAALDDPRPSIPILPRYWSHDPLPRADAAHS
jgi:hypothetical protein